MFGLLERDLNYIQKAMEGFPEIDKAIIFGSRAIGNYKKGSDIDIAILGQNVTMVTLYELEDLLNEVYPIPYFFDLLRYEELTNENLKAHIDQFGKEVYNRNAGVGSRNDIAYVKEKYYGGA